MCKTSDKKNLYLEKLRHSAAHLLAQAISELFPETIFTIGPATETGFFYDVLPKDKNFKLEDLEIISSKMKEIVKRNLKIEHYNIPKEEAKILFSKNKFKLDIINTQINEDFAGIAKQGDFLDLCKGGHVESTEFLENFLLTGISGSYWRGNRDNQALQRISGIIFETKEELDQYLKIQKELEEYDHRKLGNELDLFSFQEEGVGFPFFHPKGMIVINELKNFMRKTVLENGYQEVKTPTILSSSLWKKSGHESHYKENMYSVKIDENDFYVKPMNCPGMFLIFNSRPRSYKELPFRMFEFGHVHRHELSGTLHGLFRVRAFTQDDAHFFCRINQIQEETIRIIKITNLVMKKCGLENLYFFLSTRPEKASGEIKIWEKAINELKTALSTINVNYELKEGDGAFYGPKIEIKFKDSFGRFWTCGTIQLDFVQPDNFDLSFTNESGEKEKPVIIHQAIFGSIERFFGVLLEHHKGHLPFWLSPIQIKILPITNNQNDYAKKIEEILKKNFRASVDENSDPLNAKIQRAQKEKIPIMIVLGKKEEENNSISIRTSKGEQKNNLDINELINLLNNY